MLMKRLLAISFFLIFFSIHQGAIAEIICENCLVGDCRCAITDCEMGIFDVFSGSCSVAPDYEFTFKEGYLRWSPEVAKNYYVKVLCSDGKTQSDCTLITVSEEGKTTTTTTILKITTTTTLPEEEEKGEGAGAPDYLLIILIVILIALIGFAIYYLFFMKKTGRKTYEELYKKWGGRK